MPDGIQQIDYDGLIPEQRRPRTHDLRVRKALETWHPGYIDWWKDDGSGGIPGGHWSICARRSASISEGLGASFDYVRMPEYKWGILLAPAVEGRTIRVRRTQGRTGRGRTFRANTGRCCAACW